MDINTGLVRYDTPDEGMSVPIPQYLAGKARYCADNGIPLTSERNPYPELRQWALNVRARACWRASAPTPPPPMPLADGYSWGYRPRTPAESAERKRLIKERRRVQRINKQRNRR